MGTQYRCQNPRRAALVRDTQGSDGKPIFNGIDYLEIGPDQTTLEVYFIHDLPQAGATDTVPPPPAPELRKDQIVIEGGVRIRGEHIQVTRVSTAGKMLTVELSQAGDFSTYRLRLRDSLISDKPPAGFDSQLLEAAFSFKVGCPSDLDCQPEVVCPPKRLEDPRIDYLAKDYESFRRLMLDRLSVVMPDWKERNPADLQVALVELLAYVGDHLSYYQDAVATEAYLGTARKRVSVRRHARLLDYPMRDGCNARVWVALEVTADANDQVLLGPSSLKDQTLFLTRSNTPPGPLPKDQIEAALREGAVAFEPLNDLTLHEAHNETKFYTWGDEECCLPKGATQAFLRDDPAKRLRLRPGDVLVLMEKIDPKTGNEADANPEHRHAVRLTYVDPEAAQDPDGKRTPGSLMTDPLTDQAYVEVHWDLEDALPFPLCLSAVVQGEARADLSKALGNVLLVDHGRTVSEELPKLEEDAPPRRYRPTLQKTPLTQQALVKGRNRPAFLLTVDLEAPASAAFRWEMKDVLPAIYLLEAGGEDRPWRPQRDLLGSDRFAREFVAEVEEDGHARLRFGDDMLGAQPELGFQPQAIYRVGNGRAGNVGREAIVNVVSNVSGIRKVWNPMPAQGGTDPESLEQVRLYAPQAFRKQERAVTAADYAEVTERHPEVQKALATVRWTGSWYTVFVTIDRKGGLSVDADFEGEIRRFLERYRLAGYDLEVNAPVFVPLDLKLEVCVKPGYYQSDVKEALLQAFSNRELARGGRGFFHPDNFTFGTPVYLSQIYATAMQVAGVQSVEVLRFQRFGKAPNRELEDGMLTTGRLEIVRLDNDPNFPENGRLEIVMKGGL